MFTQKILSKSHLNKGHYTISAEFPPNIITRIGYDVISQTFFRPLNILFFPWNFAVSFRVAVRRAPHGRICEIGQGGH